MAHPHAPNRPLSSTSAGSADVKLYDASGFPIDLGQRPSDESVPVVIASDQTPIPVSGTVTTSPDVNIYDSGGAALNAVAGRLAVDGSGVVQPVSGAVSISNFPASQAVTGPLTDAELRASPVPVVGSVGVTNFPAVQPVSGTVAVSNFPAIQAVSGPLTDAELRASPVPVSGTVAVSSIPAITGSVSVTNFPAVQAISATSLPLPTGAATAANQATQIASLASIDAGIPAALGQTTMANSMPVVFASNQTSLSIVVANNAAVTYSAAIRGLPSAALATALFVLTGSATKTVRVLRTKLSATGNGNIYDVILNKRSTANTGGTSTLPVPVPHDSLFAAATAVVSAYTVNPVLGTLVGPIRAEKVNFPLATSSATPALVSFEFGNLPETPPVLRGVAESLGWCLNGITVSNGNFDIAIEWTEE